MVEPAALVSEQCARAVETLRRCASPAGLRASGREHGHREVWARDSMIALLGGALAGGTVSSALEASVRTLARGQAPNGAIPNNVNPETGRPNFRAYADSGLWFLIGSAVVKPELDAIRRVLAWYECQDVDQSGLLSIQESSDWQDLFATHGKALYVNCLYAIALRKAAGLVSGDERIRWLDRAGRVRDAVNRLLWYDGDLDMARRFTHTFSTENLDRDSLGRKRWLPEKRILRDERYYLPYIGFREAGEWFDTLGNVMAILAGVADAARSAAILDFIERHALGELPAKSIYPVIQPGEPGWRDFYGDTNQPDCYHNGGIWPFVGGFYVAALVKAGRREAAAAALGRLAALNHDGEFNEWHHGRTGEPAGVPDQAWSAGMFLYAAECVRAGRLLHF